ncbi:hypothetical protein PSMK_12830 [Phycisphaera mikurensis NBRC 102666]|uniref:Uncharacterized protein n=1 Tax=Phycisphaera mikurensis (strain NBRC 102666 / KCTC 22515 / FYK2301M01) TaxID=1142394 RepID=I0IDV4_PHYMF|nr:hypothetical protein PSMK_12830 [Phycisphaera mikurensis NBRC 102666]
MPADRGLPAAGIDGGPPGGRKGDAVRGGGRQLRLGNPTRRLVRGSADRGPVGPERPAVRGFGQPTSSPGAHRTKASMASYSARPRRS